MEQLANISGASQHVASLLTQHLARAICLQASTACAHAAEAMRELRRTALVVTDESNTPVGIVTERAILQAARSGHAPQTTIGELRSALPLRVPAGISVLDAFQLGLRCDLPYLLLVDQPGDALWLASEYDLIRALVSGLVERTQGIGPDALRGMLDALPHLVWLKDRDGAYLARNAGYRRFMAADGCLQTGGLSEEERLALETGASRCEETWSRCAAAGGSATLDVERAPMREGAGRLIGVLGIAREISGPRSWDIGLMASHEQLRGLFEHSPMGFALTDMRGRYLEFNEAFRRICGYTREELNALDYWALTPKEYAEQEAEQLRRLDREGYYGPYEKEYVRKDGARVPLRFSGVLCRDDQGKAYVWSIVEDISERKRAEQELRENQERLALATRHNGVGIWDWNPQTHKLIWDDSMYALYRIRREDFVGTVEAWRAALHPDDLARGVRELEAAAKGEKPFDTEFRVVWPDGEVRHIKAVAKLFRDQDGVPVRMLGTNVDITDLKRAEDALREREEIFSSIVNQAADSILLVDSETMQFVEFNRMAHETLGYTRDEFAGLTLCDVQAQFDAAQLRRILDEAHASGEPLLIETFHRRKDGSLRPAQVSSRPIVIRGRRYLSSIWSDITRRKEAEMKLQQSEAHFRFVSESAQALIWMAGPDKRCTWFNKVWLDFTGRTLQQEQGDGWKEGVHPDDVQRCYGNYVSHFDRREPFTMEYRLRRYDGAYRWIVDKGAPRFSADGIFEGYIGSCFDITKRRRNEENLRLTASVFETAQEAILIADAANRIIDVNPAFEHVTGYSREEALGRDPRFLSSGRHSREFHAAMWESIKKNDAWRGEIWNRRKNGEVHAELLSISAIRGEDGSVQRYVGVFSDITHFKANEAALSRVAYYDALTGIPNRVLLADRMKLALTRAEREQSVVAVCYLDLDGFKPINDAHGHDAGDQVLIEVAQRVSAIIRADDTVARLGGDEFVVLLLDLEQADACRSTLERLIAAICQPFTVKGQPISLGMSIGVSFFPLDERNPDRLLRLADAAMYRAKQRGKNRFEWWDPPHQAGSS